MSEQDVWEFNLMSALMLVKEFHMKALAQNLDPRAVRVALKYALKVDTFINKQAGLTEQNDKRMDILAEKLFKETPKI
jgi:hypothetical protein